MSTEMKKLVLKLELEDGYAKKKAMKTVSTFPGIDSITVDMKGKMLTVIGTFDLIRVVTKLRRHWQADIISVAPAKEPEKKEEAKKEEPKKEESKKEEPKPEEQKKEEPKKEDPPKEEPKKEEPKKEEEKKPDPVLEMVRLYRAYNPQMTTYYYAPSMEENPNAFCVIC